MTIQINKTGICLRPSSIDGFQRCAYQWAKVFLEGVNTIPGARAAIGTAIHSACEQLWTEAIATKKKEPNISAMTDASMEAFKEQGQKGLLYDEGENNSTAEKAIIQGINAFVDDLVPFLDIPEAVELFLKIDVANHPIVNAIGGTIDYATESIIDDVKTSKRKPVPANYSTQQSIYKHLAVENGFSITMNRIQGIVLSNNPAGHILELTPNIPKAKAAVNILLDTLTVAASGTVDLDILFRCNTQHYLCTPQYCALYGSCPATKSCTPNVAKQPII